MVEQTKDIKNYQVDTQITLTDKEEEIFTTLIDVVKEHDLKTTLRVAGGWVRDKLMGKQSVDIDVALDDMFGEEFAQLLNDKLYPGGERKFGVIKSNCEKSKHLETATIKVHGMFIDLVNLRSEKYTEKSRVPIIEKGTAEEDAYRRDLTINSMFYNINTKEIEDFTKLGLHDLKQGTIRTPLEPFQTFMDDPLRVLRTVRFATRFDFKIVEEIFEAAKNPSVRDALEEKVSYERIGKEMDLMLADKLPFNAIKYLYDFNILQLLYKFPDACKELQDQDLVNKLILQSLKISQALGCVLLLLKNEIKENGISMFLEKKYEVTGDEKIVEAFKEFQKNNFYAALLHPFYPYEYKAKNKIDKVVNKVLNDSLKKSNEVMKHVMTVLQHVNQGIEIVNRVNLVQQLSDDDRIAVGLYMREAGHKWDAIQLLAIAIEYFNLTCKDKLDQDISLVNAEFDIDEKTIKEITKKYERFNQVLQQIKLDNIHIVKPMLDGKQICDVYQIKPGKAIKFLMDEEIKFQILNPDAVYEQVLNFLVENKDQFLQKYS